MDIKITHEAGTSWDQNFSGYVYSFIYEGEKSLNRTLPENI